MINKTLFSIFKEGSNTYFYSSLFFPSVIKREVFSLYAFVRKADNFVDSIPQNLGGFQNFKKNYYKAIKGEKTGDIVIDSFAKLSNDKDFDPKWTDAFLKSMEMDITKSKYETLDETLEYIYGSAEVIGLFMSKIMHLPEESYTYARYLGRAMQYINFTRDIAEDIKLGRIYFPSSDLRKFGLDRLDYDYTIKRRDEFKQFLRKQLARYCKWQHIAEEGYKFIPKRYLIPVKTASEMYNWTADEIYKNPFVVYKIKVKPMIKQIFTKTILNIIDPRKQDDIKCICAKEDYEPQVSYL